MASQCACGRTGTFQTPTGRWMCDDHWAQFVGLSGAGSTLVGGGDAPSAVGTGIAAAHWAGASAQEQRNARRRRERLDAATGFWRRLRIRLLG